MNESNVEFELLRCLAAPRTPSFDLERARELLNRVDFESLFEGMAIHGVFPAVFKRFKNELRSAIPAPQLEKFNQHYDRTMRLNLSLIALFMEFERGLRERGIKCLVFKGPALAANLYGDAFAREFSDIDVLVHRDNALEAQRLLVSLGCVPAEEFDQPLPDTFYASEKFLDITHEHTYRRETPRGFLDLHWCIQPEHYLPLSSEEIISSSARMTLEGRVCQTLSPELAFLVNAVHAGKHQFQRMLWSVDTAYFSMQAAAIDWQKMISLARQTDTVRSVATALVLAQKLFGAEIPQEAESLITKKAKDISVEVLGNMQNFTLTPRGAFFYPLRFHVAMKERLANQLRFVTTELFKPSLDDFSRLRLERPFDSLYSILRPYWLAKEALRTRFSAS